MACRWVLGSRDSSPLSAPSFQGVAEGQEVSPQPPLLHTKPPQFPQPLPIRPVLQTLHQLRCPSLDTLESFKGLFGVRGPKLNPLIEGRPHQCRAQGSDPFPVPAGHAGAGTSQDATGLLGHPGTLLAHYQSPPGPSLTGSSPATPPQAWSAAGGCCDQSIHNNNFAGPRAGLKDPQGFPPAPFLTTPLQAPAFHTLRRSSRSQTRPLGCRRRGHPGPRVTHPFVDIHFQCLVVAWEERGVRAAGVHTDTALQRHEGAGGWVCSQK